MLLESLIIASERAANIARKCRDNKHLFQLLIEEKTEAEANPRFVQDFKTLADVLIQETLKHDIGIMYPEMRDQIKGEESNHFCNALGEQISINKLETSEDTAKLLSKVLNDDKEAARLLSEEVHKDLTIDDVTTKLPDVDIQLDYQNLGIWIDPIDSTAEYINGNNDDNLNELAISTSGLKCVTVLIGVYELDTGESVMGVVNQPFYSYEHGSWSGKCYWGVHTKTIKCSSLQSLPPESDLNEEPTNIVCLSSSEDQLIKDKLISGGYDIVETAGAGYKMLATILGLADAYLLSKSSTFKWDTCGPHAILKSLAGDIIVYEEIVHRGENITLNYKVDLSERINRIDSCSNNGGIIAFRSAVVMQKIITLLDKVADKEGA